MKFSLALGALFATSVAAFAPVATQRAISVSSTSIK